MTHPTLPPPPEGETERVPGALLIRGDCDDPAWEDVLSRMGDLPGMVVHTPGPSLPPIPEHAPTLPNQNPTLPAQAPIRRRLLVVQDPAWRGVTPVEVLQALHSDDAWVPDLVLVADRGTERDAPLRPLVAFLPGDDDFEPFRVTPRQAALTYLVTHRPSIEDTLEHQKDRGGVESEREPDESYEDWLDASPHLMREVLETAGQPPRYQPPTSPLPVITQNDSGLLVRTDFSDDRAWAAFAADADRLDPRHESSEDYAPYLQIVDDPAFDGATPEQVLAVVRQSEDDEEPGEEIVVIADRASMHGPDRSALVVPLQDDVGWSFRLPLEDVRIMVINLFVGNNDIADWMSRGLPDGPAVITEKERRAWRGW
ncbi:hypothetical protein ABZ635_10355 [Nocardiopsis sp. NPDC007018]|uniref:DUF6924 domain-containing protein n=1 Tax=Nocardiopsis sp. NPDC007018 TaxID=3155721 RepID=UPI0034074BDE